MADDALPFFSVIIPTRDRWSQLDRCLDALSQLAYPRERYEVIVVDDGTHGPGALRPGGMPATWTLITQPPGGPGVARNTGAAVAKGDYLVFTADDCVPDRAWLRALAEYCRRAPDAALAGGIVNGLPDNLFSEASHLVTEYVTRHAGGTAETAGTAFATPNNLTVPCRLFRSIGGFDPAFARCGEDRDFCDRWLRRGFTIVQAREATVHHGHPLTLRSFVRQQFAYGRGSYEFRKRRRGGTRFEPASFYWKLITYPFSRETGSRAVALSALAALSQLAIVVAFSSAAWRARRPPVAS